MTVNEELVKRLEELLCSDRKEVGGSHLQTAASHVSIPFILPQELQVLFTYFEGWSGHIGDQYFRFFEIREIAERTEELRECGLPKSLVAIGDNGASETLFVEASGDILVGDEIGLPKSLSRVSKSLLSLLERPQMLDEAFSQ